MTIITFMSWANNCWATDLPTSMARELLIIPLGKQLHSLASHVYSQCNNWVLLFFSECNVEPCYYGH